MPAKYLSGKSREQAEGEPFYKMKKSGRGGLSGDRYAAKRLPKKRVSV